MINMFEEENRFFYENGFMLTSTPDRLGTMFAHYDLYKKSLGLPGSIVELGVFKGSSLVQWATFRWIHESDDSRKIIAFDVFGEFPEDRLGTVVNDKQIVETWNEQFKDEFVSKEDMEKSFEKKGFTNYEFIHGDIRETLPEYVEGGGRASKDFAFTY